MYDNDEKSVPWIIYLSRGLSAWGDRLWSFGLGIFINLLGPENFRLVAIYGFSTSISVIIFGSFVGAWVDKNNRLTTAKTFLGIQNSIVALCCTILAIFFGLVGQEEWPEKATSALAPITIIFAVIANLASVGTKIAVEKDWIIVIADKDSDRLAKMNATFRTIDLLCSLLAPLLAGLLFEFTSNLGAAIFIAVWNLVSVVAEYALLLSIYIQYPALADKSTSEFENPDEDGKVKTVLKSIKRILKDSIISWKIYLSQSARSAGIGLAFLYMTVLGFDNITYGYCLKMCIKESVIGAMVGLSAIFGVCGSLTFPALRKKFGINRTGTIGFACLISVLSLSVLSIGLPGTLFEPKRGPEIFRYRNFSGNNESDSISNVSFIALAINSSFTNSTSFLEPEMKRKFNETIEKSIMNGTLFIEKKPVCFSSNYVSIGFFLAGVVGARFGLWIADLSINQILLEEVSEDHRGKINGVQTGLNSFMNTLKYLLVILIPDTETFGWLIMLSYLFACFGTICYVLYAERSKVKPLSSTDDEKEVKND